jgi:hypothetical protein
MSPRRSASANTNMSTRTSNLSLTSIDIDDNGSVSMMDTQQYVYPRSSGLPLEVEIVKEEEQFGDDCCLDDEDDDDCEDDEEDDCQDSTGSTAAWKHYNRALLFAESEMYDACL